MKSGNPVSDDRMKLGESPLVRELTDWLKALVAAIVIVFLLNQFVFHLSRVEGHSMDPTLADGEWLFINKLVYIFFEPKAGDIIILENPMGGREKYLVKRIVGMPGDRIEIVDGILYRNGEPVDEPYTDSKIEDGDWGPAVVPEGAYFVMGDNRHRGESNDSRNPAIGWITKDMIKGKADYILWPIWKIGNI
jgi:signal peptidase I